MLSTLVGPGTQWIDVGEGPSGAINDLAPGDVALFKGRLWIEEPAILHRSPPVGASGASRLLLVLDVDQANVPMTAAGQGHAKPVPS